MGLTKHYPTDGAIKEMAALCAAHSQPVHALYQLSIYLLACREGSEEQFPLAGNPDLVDALGGLTADRWMAANHRFCGVAA